MDLTKPSARSSLIQSLARSALQDDKKECLSTLNLREPEHHECAQSQRMRAEETYADLAAIDHGFATHNSRGLTSYLAILKI